MKPPTGALKVASADQGPTAPWKAARARHVYVASGVSATDGECCTLSGPAPTPPMTPESYTTLPPLRIWNWYDNGAGANFICALVAMRTSASGCAPLTGDTGEGAVAFNVEPSGAAPLSDAVAEDGLVGVCDDLPHASASTNAAVAAHRRIFRDINGAPEKFGLMHLGTSRIVTWILAIGNAPLGYHRATISSSLGDRLARSSSTAQQETTI